MTEPEHGGVAHHRLTGGLLLGALGVVYGDIGTSPIYTLRESFKAAGAAGNPAVVLGVLSLLFWTVTIIVTFKYITLVTRADNGGEGGIIALMSTALPRLEPGGRAFQVLLTLGLCGAALFYGDGVITPAISVLSAVEGLNVATPVFAHYVVPITVVILIGLFAVQRRGSGSIGRYFGPVMVIWFVTIGLLGLLQVVRHPGVLAAFDPRYALGFCLAAPGTAFLTLGSVVLAVTGSESFYADMGHFGPGAIRIDWLALVMPALLLNYAGQAALVLQDPGALDNPFFRLAPDWGLYPMVLLTACATVIASQAVISGAFSMTQQAMQLGLLPRLEIRQTSEESLGQVYVPQVNWALMVAVVGLVLAFKSSDALAAAYGIANTGLMLVTSILLAVVMRRVWGWNLALVVPVAGFLALVDALFFAANVLKIPEGGWFPLVLATIMFLLMTTWRDGRRIVLERLGEENVGLQDLFARLKKESVGRVRGTAVYLTTRYEQVPSALAENLKHNGVLHERIVFLKVMAERTPRIPEAQRVEHASLGDGFERMTLHVGFAEKPDVPAMLAQHNELKLDPARASFFLGRETPVPTLDPPIAIWREKLFAFMTRNAVSAPDYFRIPAERVVELGTRVEL